MPSTTERDKKSTVSQPTRHRGRSVLDRWYPVLFELGLCFALLILITVVRIDIRFQRSFEIEDVAPAVVQLEDIAQTEHIERPPPPPRPLPPVQVPDETVLEDEILEIDAEIDIFEAPDIPPPPPPPASNGEEDDPEIFVVVEEMPVLVGGMERLHELVQYPEIAVRANIEGLVVVTFVVERDGKVSEIEVLRSAGGLLDEAAVSAVSKLEFIPGKQRGKPVRVRFSLPVRFRITPANDVM